MKNLLLTEGGYVPDWFRRDCGWAAQKTLVNYDLPFLGSRPRGLVWMRKRARIAVKRLNERQLALDELARISFICAACRWCGGGDALLHVAVYRWDASTIAHVILDDDPNRWNLTECPNCDASAVVPDYQGLSVDKVLRRWLAMNKPTLEDPRAGRFEAAAAPDLHTLFSTSDIDLDWPRPDALRAWFSDVNYGQEGLRASELMFLAQQMWDTLETTVTACRDTAVDGAKSA